MRIYPQITSQYIAESGNIRTHHSRQSYRKIMRLLQSAHPGKNIGEFTVEDLTSFCVARFDGQPGHAAPSTQRNRRAHIRSTFEWAQWRGLIKHNPALELKFTVRPGNGNVRTGTWLSREQVQKIAVELGTDDPQDQRDRILFLLGVFTGLRRFELATLTWSQFDPELTQLKLKGKGDKIETIGVPPELREALGAWRALNGAGGVAVLPSFKWVNDPASGRRRRRIDWNTCLGEAGVGYVVADIGDKVGIHLEPHDLRRTFAGLLEAAGVSMKDIQLAMRHENIGTTDRYLAKNPARTVAVTREFRLGI